MKKRALILALSSLAITLSSIFTTNVYAQNSIEDELKLLDSTLEMANDYYKNKETLIASLESLLTYPNTSLEQKYTIYGQLFNENFSYSFDQALSAVNNQETIAKSLGEKYLQQVRLDKALLLTTAGLYLETRELLENQIDTTRFTHEQQNQYYYLMQRYWKDYKEYSDGKEFYEAPVSSKYHYFRERYLEESDEDNFEHKQLIIFNLMDDEKYQEANARNTQLLSELDPQSHNYAIMAYYQALIREALGHPDERLHWLIQSSLCDIKNAVKDYASLSSIATDILSTDVERSSHYIQISIEDAMFYNAKLRPWQLARLLPDIDNAYKAKVEATQIRAKKKNNILGAISSILFILALALGYILRKQTDKKKYLKDLLEGTNVTINEYLGENREIRKAFERLADSNNVKREQFVAILGACNSLLDKAKKNLSPEQREAELKQYYSTFDNAFIQMYPTFVEDFNALLKPDQQIELKKDDILNTELRIFALIRLGVTQSSSIATLLRYSVNTIYNYRAQIKNAALNEREDFEKNVRNIGKVEI